MKRSIFLIVEYGGEYEDSWERTRDFGFLTYEEAEQQLLKKGWKKEERGGWITYENPCNDHWYYSPYCARITEHKFYDSEMKKGIKTYVNKHMIITAETIDDYVERKISEKGKEGEI